MTSAGSNKQVLLAIQQVLNNITILQKINSEMTPPRSPAMTPLWLHSWGSSTATAIAAPSHHRRRGLPNHEHCPTWIPNLLCLLRPRLMIRRFCPALPNRVNQQNCNSSCWVSGHCSSFHSCFSATHSRCFCIGCRSPSHTCRRLQSHPRQRCCTCPSPQQP